MKALLFRVWGHDCEVGANGAMGRSWEHDSGLLMRVQDAMTTADSEFQ